ncbi:hypothetical protein GCM10011344_27560 [Dokdonia pacifica]|uniref:CR-type domain-containing protein n=1 Tax=Dokdonia pacifica TaxID=1627892 RepID=A0A239CEH6_9FLAO|nr:hypothetical protein [Dokdonia pacifica]GGG25361.1 hypothetical protein GCM10011344_27560 [Dokdonia pacifica]SNS18635.1 hypothetical protein SAMN06265376_107289 [Dokdonia pacifica]
MEKDCTNALNQISQKVETLTRFDIEVLKVVSCRKRNSLGEVNWSFRPIISIEKKSGKGKIPYTAIPKNDLEDLNSQTTKDYEKALEDLPQKLIKWDELNKTNDKELTPHDCFKGPITYGYHFQCRDCGGQGWNQCGNCRGKGSNTCDKCNTKGYIQCSKCINIWGNNTGKIKGETCPTCQGRKTITCNKCQGQGNLRCKRCNGSGTISCRSCGNTGFFHELMILTCVVNTVYKYIPNPKEKNKQIIQELNRRNLKDLQKISKVHRIESKIHNKSITRNYNSNCSITELIIKILDKKLIFIGYGENEIIFNYNNIVSILLEADLIVLERTLNLSKYKLWGTLIELSDNVGRVLESEINTMATKSSLIQDGIINKNYADRIKTALSKSLKKIIFCKLGTPLLTLCLLCLFIFAIDYFVDINLILGMWKYTLYILIPTFTWFLFEANVRKKVSNEINESSCKDIDVTYLFKRYNTMSNYRIIALIPIVMLLVIILLL